MRKPLQGTSGSSACWTGSSALIRMHITGIKRPPSVYCDRLGGVIAAYKVVPDEMDEIKVST